MVAPSDGRPVALYTRISQDRIGAGLGVDRQQDICEKWAANRGLVIGERFVDNDLSAYSGKPRPGYKAMLAGLRAGRFGGVLVYHTDRLHRHPRELEDYIDLTEAAGAPTYSATGGEVDLSTPGGRQMARVIGAMSRGESEHKAQRIRDKHEQSAKAGKWRGGGAAPFGYRPDPSAPGGLRIEPGEARLIRHGVEMLLRRKRSLVKIARVWAATEAGAGRVWNSTTVGQVFRSPRIAGLSVHNGVIVGKAMWPGILEEEAWRTLQAVLSAPSRRTSASTAGRHLMAGLIRCHCGAVMRTGTGPKYKDGTRRSQYKCTGDGCGKARIAGPIDDLVAEAVIERLSREDAADLLVPSVSADEMAAMKRERDGLRKQITDSLALFKARIIDADELTELRAELNQKLADIEGRLADPGRVDVLGELVEARDPREVWGRYTWRQRRRVVDVLLAVSVREIPKTAARRFDPNSVVLDWL